MNQFSVRKWNGNKNFIRLYFVSSACAATIPSIPNVAASVKFAAVLIWDRCEDVHKFFYAENEFTRRFVNIQREEIKPFNLIGHIATTTP